MGRTKIKADQRAETRGGRWVGIPHVVIDSAAYRSLSDRAVRILLELLRAFNGYNNGEIGVSQRQLAEALGMQNYGAIGRGLAELMERGLIEVTAEGKWKERESRLYRITFVTTCKPGRPGPATNDYLAWEGNPRRTKSGDEAASAVGTRSAERFSARAGIAAEDVSARIARTRRKTAISEKPAAENVSSLIGKPYPAAKTASTKTPQLPLKNPVADRSVADMANVRGEVWTALQAVRTKHGLSKVRSLAKLASLNPDRVVGFVEGRDDLTGPLILHMRRTLCIHAPDEVAQ